MTPEERILWYDLLCRLPMRVRKQSVIKNYIVDFYIAEAQIVIELDGSQHYEEEGIQKDIIRDERLKSLGFKVLRYTNLDIHWRFKEVCADIENYIAEICNTSSDG